eukprot:61278-Hanusia_phi.AAC.1
MLGPNCDVLCLGKVVDNTCNEQTSSSLLSKSETVNGSYGGDISLGEWGQLSMPAGFYNGKLDLTIHVYNQVPFSSDPSTGPTIVLEPTGAEFSQALTLSLSVSHIKDVISAPVALYYLNPSDESWEYVESNLDLEKRTLTAYLHHFSIYAVRRKAQETQPAGVNPSTNATLSPDAGVTTSKNSNLQLIVAISVSCAAGALALVLVTYYRRTILQRLKPSGSLESNLIPVEIRSTGESLTLRSELQHESPLLPDVPSLDSQPTQDSISLEESRTVEQQAANIAVKPEQQAASIAVKAEQQAA